MLRRDLATVQELAGQVASGMPADQAKAQIDALEANSPLWQLRVNCLHYCRFVHSHHNLEDIAIFPILREANPALGPVVDRLEGDHKVVSGQLEEVEEAASQLVSDQSQFTRDRLVSGLEILAVTLLEHLQFEEEEAGPTIRRLARIG